MNVDINNLIGHIVSKLKSIRGVKAVVLGGSRADNSNRSDSDIDL
jgi:predicted nucleotidyltransferase